MRREDDAGSLRRGKLRYFPVVPARLEFTQRLRETLLEEKPAVVAGCRRRRKRRVFRN
jgi:hypothetical protein